MPQLQTTVPVITLHRPWAWAIAHAGKDVENRDWAYRGRVGSPLLIHAGKKFNEQELAYIKKVLGVYVPVELESHPTGIICLTLFQGCTINHQSPWAVPGKQHWQLKRIATLEEPIEIGGGRGIWHYPIARLPEAIAAAAIAAWENVGMAVELLDGC